MAAPANRIFTFVSTDLVSDYPLLYISMSQPSTIAWTADGSLLHHDHPDDAYSLYLKEAGVVLEYGNYVEVETKVRVDTVRTGGNISLIFRSSQVDRLSFYNRGAIIVPYFYAYNQWRMLEMTVNDSDKGGVFVTRATYSGDSPTATFRVLKATVTTDNICKVFIGGIERMSALLSETVLRANSNLGIVKYRLDTSWEYITAREIGGLIVRKTLARGITLRSGPGL